MTLSKLEESALLQAYDTYWQSYLTGDISTLASLLADDYTQIGSVETEVFDNKKDAVHFIETTIDQIAGKLEMRNRVKKLEQVDPFMLITEQTDLYVLTEGDWVYYAKFRASSFLQKKDGQWKFIHQHSSMPDIRAEEGENIATEKISRENIELRDAIKRRTIELEQKNRELAMEASLERVRTVAMGLRKPDDLPGICEVLFNELRGMGFTELRNAMINIHNDEKSTFINYDYSEEIGPSINHLNYTIHPVIEKQIKQIRSTHDAFSETVFSGQDLEDWKTFRKRIGEKDDPRIDNVSALYYYFYSIGTGAIGISTFGSISSEKLEQLKRFRNVFEFAYRRYMDVAQAEAQVREAQIEAALERIRSRSLAMHHSDELRDVVGVTYKILGEIQVKNDTIAFQVFDFVNKSSVFWPGNNLSDAAPKVMLPFNEAIMKEDTCHRDLWEAMSTGKDIINKVYSKTQKDRWFEYVFMNNDVQVIPENARQFILQSEIHTVCFFPEKNSGVFADTWNGSQYTDSDLAVLKRVGKVFEQAYTRFLDLQKAETQARESQIQLALERVRARTMAMQTSNDLLDVANVLREQMGNLGQPELESCIVHLYNDNSPLLEAWYAFRPPNLSSNEIITGVGIVPKDSSAWSREVMAKYNSQESEYTIVASGEKILEWYKVLEHYVIAVVDYDVNGRLLVPEILYYHFSRFSGGALLMISTQEPSAEARELQRRSAVVFDLAYTRFLDLKKAEAQAHEAKIEASLEKVRSRSLAMHDSNELSELVGTLFNELIKLDLVLARCIIWILNEDESAQLWMANSENKQLANCYHINRIDHSYYISILKGWRERNEKWVYELKDAEKANIDQILLFDTELSQLPEEVKRGILSSKQTYVSGAFNKYGLIEASGPVHHTEEQLQMLHKFNNIFEQSYTRFIDLQKAEARARGAQIELALERVRAKTMAIQKPEEFVDVISVIGEQFAHLGFDNEWVNFGANGLDISKGIDIWELIFMPGHYQSAQRVFIPYTDHAVFNNLIEQFKRYKETGNDFFTILLEKKELGKWLDHQYNETIYKEMPADVKALGYSKPGCVSSYIILKDTWFEVGKFGKIHFTDEQNEIFKRFANAFGQAHTRFLDLQKAEAQAREALIEAALERVRSRSMGMQKSDELKEVIKLVYQQLINLKIKLDHSGFVVDYTLGGDWHFWIADELDLPSKITHPYFESVWANQFNKAKEKGADFFATHLNFEEKNKFYQELLSYIPGLTEASKDFYLNCPGLAVSTVLFDNSSLYIENFSGIPYTDEENTIVMRFGKVFEQAYIRFNDLKQAEIQAREAQVELALERVRARTMAMQKSTELGDVATVLFNELRGLGGVHLWTTGIGLCKKDDPIDEFWMCTEAGIQPPFYIPHTEDPTHKNMYAAWESGDVYYTEQKEGAELKAHYDYLMSLPAVRPIFEKMAAAGFPVPAWQKWHAAYFSKGYLLIITTEPYGEEYLFKRFAQVFQQTYTRFLDLQKAEAQAVEAQIELGLERVRARAMAMQDSRELSDLVATLLHELTKLDFSLTFCIINIYNEPDLSNMVWAANPQEGNAPESYCMKFEDYPFHHAMMREWKAGTPKYVYVMEGKEKEIYDDYLYTVTEFKRFPKEIQTANRALERYVASFVFSQFGGLQTVGDKPLSNESLDILYRFGKVFDQTYTRFLDLQKAEEQAREAQIEVSMERVRSRSMAMHKSDELLEAGEIIFMEMQKLGIESLTAGYVLIDKEGKKGLNYAPNPFTKKIMPLPVIIPHDETIHLQQVVENWLKGNPFFIVELDEDETIQHQTFIAERSINFPLNAAELIAISPAKLFLHNFYFKEGYILIVGGTKLSAEQTDIMLRFAKVFQQTYTRFLDLKKAEAQAREAQIEAALERTRTQSMIMQHSSELNEALRVFHQQVLLLGIQSAFSFLWLPDENKDRHIFWAAWANSNATDFSSKAINYPLDRKEPATAQCLLDWRSNEPVYSYHVPPAGIENYFAVWNELISGVEHLKPEYFTDGLYYVEAFMKYGCFGVMVGSELNEDEKKILARFAIEFERTYTRFLDLKKSEAQAREATIETSLERMRAKTMAMHSSDDVSSTTASMFSELEKLGVENLRGGIAIVSEDQTMEVWSVTNLADSKTVKGVGTFDMRAHPVWQRLFESWKIKEEFYVDYLTGIGKENYINVINKNPHYLSQPIGQLPDLYFQGYNFGEGYIWTNSLQPHDQENKQVMKKFAAVFSLTFRRYLDLKKAEAQAREATIEAALEKVRGKSIAMHDSNDVTSTASEVFTELKKLGIRPMRCGVGLLNKDSRKVMLYSATGSGDVENLSLVGWVMLEGHEVLSAIYDSWANNEDYFPVMEGNLLKTYNEKIQSGFVVPNAQSDYKQYGYFMAFSVGTFYGWSEKPFTEEEIKILYRFKSIIDLTFKRYIELQISEANALDAIRRASLDRVRAETASMRTTGDLEKITPMIWNELSTLGVPFIRCGVFIMDEAQELIHTFLSTPDGKAIASFHLPYKASADLWETVTHWRKKEIYQQHWDESAFIEWTKNLMQQGFINSSDSYATEQRPTNLYLHFLPFMQGMLYVGNDAALNESDLHLVQNLADAFSTAYARYEDFNRLEAAKEQVDKTLTDLKQAQSQLVQAEKMASLGELTAGIAHEIQNPLNFVNNFSEINTELSDEIVEAAKKGDLEEIIQLAADIKSNQDKISEHGKRADAIVKGMLQHSRSSSGIKESTDINKLADEYFRLSYHGLRAKDKTFNATLHTDFDPAIGKIPIMPQDIGRVLLNLYNNAFYAVSERMKSAPKGYEPQVTVSTRLVPASENSLLSAGTAPIRQFPPFGGHGANSLIISVKDNGMGIPKKVLDKIFQPFFTTKPTGEGTGLGLSLSYDIVKAHGGELRVETKDGEGSEFIVNLPVN